MRIAKGVVVVLVLAGVVYAQSRTAAQNTDPMANLTAEVRLLRLAVEKGTQTQTQIQGLSVYLSAQQSRLVQLSTRLDGFRRELDVAARQSGEQNDRVAEMQKALGDGQLNAVERTAVTSALARVRTDLARATERETQARNREGQAAAELQTELARWSDLIGRLEQLTKLP